MITEHRTFSLQQLAGRLSYIHWTEISLQLFNTINQSINQSLFFHNHEAVHRFVTAGFVRNFKTMAPNLGH